MLQGADPARGDHLEARGAGHGLQGGQVRPAQHAVSGDIRIYYTLYTRAAQGAGDIQGLEFAHFLPAAYSHEAVPGIQPHHDPFRAETRDRLSGEPRIGQHRGAQDHPAHSERQNALNVLQAADAAAKLHRGAALHRPDDTFHSGEVFRLALESAVQVNHVDKPGPGPGETLGRNGGIIEIFGALALFTLAQPHRAPVHQVDGGQDSHRHGQSSHISAKFFSIRRPASWLFSG